LNLFNHKKSKMVNMAPITNLRLARRAVQALDNILAVAEAVEVGDADLAADHQHGLDQAAEVLADMLGRLVIHDRNCPAGSAELPSAPPHGVDNADSPTDNANATQVEVCTVWLRERLEEGPVRLSEIRNAATESGFSARSLYGARDHLSVLETETEDGKKMWQLPDIAGDVGQA
jgi:hypothetical protein